MHILFVGNPNTGKTALINAIAKSDLEVGNWPGVTVEKKEAEFTYEGEKVALVDLPGAYTLSPYSLEEKITRNMLAEGKFEGIINVIDTTNLRRNLYLTLELIDMQKPMAIALNMFDNFTKRGYELDTGTLEEILGVPVVPTIASRGLSTQKLIDSAIAAVKEQTLPHIQPYQEHIEKEITFLIHAMPKTDLPPRLFAIQLLAGDPYALSLAETMEKNDLIEKSAQARGRLEAHMKLPIKTIITRARYEVIDRLLDIVLKKPILDKVLLSEKIDAVLLHKWLGTPLFFAIMMLMFKLTFDGSGPLVAWISGFFQDFLGKHLSLGLQNTAPSWLESLLSDGILSGVGLVLSFLPLLFLLYFFMAMLEESGYMARVSFLLDRAGRSLGIKGNAFIPMIIGFGCNVPAVFATRALTSKRERIITSLMVPLMSCSARLPIYALFTMIFFQEHQVLVIMSLYLLGITVALILGWVSNRILPSERSNPFFLELPAYHMPNLNAVWILMRPKLRDFVVKAGTVIVMASIVLWGVIKLPVGTDPQDSYLAVAAKQITPLFKPAGFGEHWEPVAAMIPGTLAKEIVIGSLGTIYGTETKNEQTKGTLRKDAVIQFKALGTAVANAFLHMFNIHKENTDGVPQMNTLQQKLKEQFPSPLAAFSYLVFILLYIPCVSTMAAIKEELGVRWMLFETALLPLVAYGVSVLVYQLGLRFLPLF
ncbi:ferrous iron transport protein B [Sulfurovum riftiae]|uniref:Ferrous iron transport protein B n=1 Tax=Sulfurovum riftiae TaxID=1630136 RepID=A0A151CI96_9BACT|nr:ferrous iron transport protein B [Sulfurovum riftiae]KYJ87258.1 ferrous iron transporter B [Sulfurovum riftiae]